MGKELNNAKKTPITFPAQNKILHLGLGSFHRAHQALYLQLLLDQEEADHWSIIGANIRNDAAALIKALQEQKGKYILETVTPEGKRAYKTITSIKEVLPFTPDLAAVIEAAANEETKIISFTVTEGGYYLENNTINLEHPDIKNDLVYGTLSTIYGVMTAILHERKTPVTLLSCDNLRANGARFRKGLLEFLKAKGDTDLIEWVNENTTSPCCMVDRITPRPTKELEEQVLKATGKKDLCPVMAEDFKQWIIEDNFIAGRPNWDKAGAEFVTDVHPYEEAKIRILNASHSVVAWAGTVKGHKYIHQAMTDRHIVNLVRNYVMEDVIPCLEPSPLNLKEYLETALNRFHNQALRDTCQRVAADSYSKIPGFILPTFKARVKKNLIFQPTASIIAVFFIFLQMLEQGNVPYMYHDPTCDREKLHNMMSSEDPIRELGHDPVLWWDLAGSEALITALKAAYKTVSLWLKPQILI